ncbi:hypothetical protein RJ640_017650 [Escallonia rubra]|uniref:Uncharacterized protein n=1 Tax=Escallonia rubra TaxID=112253 RepID=A0AA88REB1_9ASTE|nr:hypothetical protein RJ640_017650 [Escallonia rubra]
MSSSSTKLCFNSNCKDLLELSRRGWRRRTGEYADLCDRCASAYEEGKFCETFHLNASGWRCCESCGKQIHCGCIVSFHMFVLLDAGGIECITCARKSFILTPNPAWPPPSNFLPVLPERIKDISVKNWNPIAGSGPVPWRQAPSLFNASSAQSELHPKMPFEVEIPGGIDRLLASERLSASSLDKKKKEDSSERLVNGSLKGTPATVENGTAVINCEGKPEPSIKVPQQSPFIKDETSTPHFSLALTSLSKNETNDQSKVSGSYAQRGHPPLPVGKQLGSHNGTFSSGETQVRNGRPRADSRGRNHLLPRYWPRITDQELQKLSGEYPLMLSASDAGRIGRLVLPKKCAEAYFPPISQAEGVPLVVQDLKGKEWVFQFRFWPNNNSRMYVLEGVTPCIQSMQLQAGDVVTFSRLEPEGKLVMGFRKASVVPPSDQGNETVNTGNGVSIHGDVNTRTANSGEVISIYRHSKMSSKPSSFLPVNQATVADPSRTVSEVNKFGYIAADVFDAQPAFRTKRKNSTLGSKSKRLRIENEDMIELKLTWEQAQGLLRPPPNHVPSVMVIEGFEFEEYEDAPIIGRPTLLAADHMGEMVQWAQCEDCFKWRRVPADALFPSRWTCSENLWDPERSACSAVQELTSQELEDLLPNNQAASKKIIAASHDADTLEALEGLDALANLAIMEVGETHQSSSQATTRHPRHRPGCTCIVCIQPPSGKGLKHKNTCTCNVCQTVKRRFRTQMLRREKRQSVKGAETARQKLQQPQLLEVPDDDIQLLDSDTDNSNPSVSIAADEGSDDDLSKRKSSTSPFKGQIDLNIQPEREEEPSPVSNSGSMLRELYDATERYFRQQPLPSSGGSKNIVGNGTPVGSSLQNSDRDRPVTLSVKPPASTSASGR